MKPSRWLPLVISVVAVQGVSAQPYPNYPGAPGGYYGPGAVPFQGPYQGPGYAPGPMSGYPSASQPRGMPPEMGRGGPMRPRGPAPQSRSLPPELQAAATLKAGIDKMMKYLRGPGASNKAQLASFLDRDIAPYFDFDYMAQYVAGPLYQRMPIPERKALAGKLEQDFLGTLTAQLSGYGGQQIRIQQPQRGARGSVSVDVAVLNEGAPPTMLEFRLYKAETNWKVYDVLANGRSAAANFRVEFQRAAMAQRGPRGG